MEPRDVRWASISSSSNARPFCHCRWSCSRRFTRSGAWSTPTAISRSNGRTTRSRRNTSDAKSGCDGTLGSSGSSTSRMQQIALHCKREPGGFSTPPEYIAAEKISGVERGAAWLLQKVAIRIRPEERRLGRGDDQSPRRRGYTGALGHPQSGRPLFARLQLSGPATLPLVTGLTICGPSERS